MLTVLAKPLRSLWTFGNEFALNIDTTGFPVRRPRNSDGDRQWWRADFSPDAKHDDGSNYASPDYFYLYRIARMLNPSPDDVFYDLGSGKGRMLCVMARKRLRKCVGIELFEHLCETASQNAQRLRGRRSPIQVVCGDAAKADLSDGTIYFMFNPFGIRTMRDVLDNIERSLSLKPRRLSIAYHNALHEKAFAERSWLEQYDSFRSLKGTAVTFWRNRAGCDARSKPGARAAIPFQSRTGAAT
jgi:precorrin-6B methylase 2